MTKKDYKIIVETIAYIYNSMITNQKPNTAEKRIIADTCLSLLDRFAMKFEIDNQKFNGRKFFDYFVKELHHADIPNDLLKSAENLIANK